LLLFPQRCFERSSRRIHTCSRTERQKGFAGGNFEIFFATTESKVAVGRRNKVTCAIGYGSEKPRLHLYRIFAARIQLTWPVQAPTKYEMLINLQKQKFLASESLTSEAAADIPPLVRRGGTGDADIELFLAAWRRHANALCRGGRINGCIGERFHDRSSVQTVNTCDQQHARPA
jgi:hypothetical protein